MIDIRNRCRHYPFRRPVKGYERCADPASRRTYRRERIFSEATRVGFLCGPAVGEDFQSLGRRKGAILTCLGRNLSGSVRVYGKGFPADARHSRCGPPSCFSPRREFNP